MIALAGRGLALSNVYRASTDMTALEYNNFTCDDLHVSGFSLDIVPLLEFIDIRVRDQVFIAVRQDYFLLESSYFYCSSTTRLSVKSIT